MRTYIPERQQKTRRWTDKPGDYETAFRANRRRVCGEKGKRLQRRRSEECERSFAHVCETGGGRRSWLRGTVNVAKAHLLRCAAHNLALLLRKCFGLAKPRSGAVFFSLLFRLWSRMAALFARFARRLNEHTQETALSARQLEVLELLAKGLSNKEIGRAHV